MKDLLNIFSIKTNIFVLVLIEPSFYNRETIIVWFYRKFVIQQMRFVSNQWHNELNI